MKTSVRELIESFLPYVNQGGMLSMTEQEREYDNAKDVTILHLENKLEFIDVIENETDGDYGQGLISYLDIQRDYIYKLIDEVKKIKTMKTNVSIKFNSIEEYREIEKKLIELGYMNDKEWNELQTNEIGFLWLSEDLLYVKLKYILDEVVYNSLEEFLKD